MSTTKLGKLISSEEGKCRGPRYGQVYTAPAGEKGFVAGCKNTSCLSLGLLYAERFPTLSDAQDYAVSLTDY